MASLKLSGMKMTGDRQVRARLRRIGQTAPQAVVMGIMALGERIAADAVKRTPVDSGRLRASVYVAPPQKIARGTVEVGFGTTYAPSVHERTEARHTTGEAKFLERAVLSLTGQGLRIVADTAERFVESGAPAPRSSYPTGTKGGK